MSKELFVERKFSEASLATIERANIIIRAFQKDGFTLTLRGLYYQFVKRNWIVNKQSEYKRLGSIINDARLAGMIDWSALEDRTRRVNRPAAWESPAQIIEAVAEQYREDIWAKQPYAPEVWIEKDALLGVVEPVCDRHRLPLFACRGNASQSAVYEAGKRFEAVIADGRTPLVLYLGDHDPTGIDITRDNRDRLAMFAYERVEVRRLALTYEQIQQYNPPPNPVKESDGRSADYIEKFGLHCWELDALDPHVIDAVIDAEVKTLINQKRWKEVIDHEKIGQAQLKDVSDNWDDVLQFLEDNK